MLEQRMELDVRLVKSRVSLYIFCKLSFLVKFKYIHSVQLSVFECKKYVTRYHILHVIRELKKKAI